MLSRMILGEPDDRELSRQESLSLLTTEPYGRLVLVRGGLPTVYPVNFVLDGAGLVIRTREGSSLCAAAGAAAVALQVDSIDRERRSGWSVTVVGRARIADDPVEVSRLARLPLQPWVRGVRNVFVVIELGTISGQRIGGAEKVHGAQAMGAPRSSIPGPSPLPSVPTPA